MNLRVDRKSEDYEEYIGYVMIDIWHEKVKIVE